MKKAAASSGSQDNSDKPSTSRGSGKKEDGNQNVFPATANKRKLPSITFIDNELCRHLTGNTISALSNRHNYFANYPVEMKKEAEKILGKKYASKEQQVLDLFQALHMKPSFTEIPSIGGGECLIGVEGDCDYDFLIVANKSEIHDEVLNFFRCMLR